MYDCFCVQVYDLTTTNIGFLEDSSNHKAMFPEQSKNVPRNFVSIAQGYPWNIAMKMKFIKTKCSKNCFVGYLVKSCEILLVIL